MGNRFGEPTERHQVLGHVKPRRDSGVARRIRVRGGQELRQRVVERMEVPPEAFMALDDGQLDQLGDLLETLNQPPADG